MSDLEHRVSVLEARLGISPSSAAEPCCHPGATIFKARNYKAMAYYCAACLQEVPAPLSAEPCVHLLEGTMPYCLRCGRGIRPSSAESTTPTPSESSPSDQQSTSVFRVAANCECAHASPHRPILIPIVEPFGWELRCPANCGALWATVLTPAPVFVPDA